MKVMYNLHGAERKQLVAAVSEVVGVEAIYQRTPTYSYLVGGFEITKDGTLVALEGTTMDEFEQMLARLYERGFRYDAREDDPTTPDHDPTRFEISVPLAGFTDTQLEMLEKLIASKDSLIRKALGIEALSIVVDEDKIIFHWFDRALDSFEIKTYTHFIAALCETAKTQKRVVAKDKAVTSERFAFRIFLNRLGFAGREYADERKLLYKNLTGDCAFPNPQKRDEHAARWRARRKQQKVGAHDDAPESTSDEASVD